jgi:hypothetical protein
LQEVIVPWLKQGKLMKKAGVKDFFHLKSDKEETPDFNDLYRLNLHF